MAADLLEELNLKLAGDRVILNGPGREFSLDRTAALCRRLERLMQQEAVTLPALCADNGPSWVVADLVCQSMNMCLVPLPTFFSPLQLKASLGQCRASHLLTDNPAMFQGLIDAGVPPVDPETGLYLCRIDGIHGTETSMPKNTGKITFTSGSTGAAKGVCLSNEQLLLQARALADAVGLKAPRHLCLLPLATLLENVAGVYAPLLAGGRVILPSLQELGYRGSVLADPARMLRLISATAPDTMILIPELLKLLVAAMQGGWEAPDSFKFIAVGGSKVSLALLREARALGLPVYEGYGLSECASVVSLNTPADHFDGSCGKPLPHLTLQFRGGEIVVKGNAMLGYLNRPETWYPEEIRTGDLGYEDDHGFVHLQGRKKNILVSSYGRNISPEWPESELLANPLLRDAVVFGDARPWCVALIGPRDVSLSDKDIQAWVDRVNAALPDYARVGAWHRLDRPLMSMEGMLTRNGRPCRGAIARHFATEIDALYLQPIPELDAATAGAAREDNP